MLTKELPTVENGGVVMDESAETMDVTWQMREDVTWADGAPLTADDVLFGEGLRDAFGPYKLMRKAGEV